MEVIYRDGDGNLNTGGKKILVSAGETSQSTGLTATASGTQGTGLKVNSDINVIATCAASGTVTLTAPPPNVITKVLIVNKGANTLQVYPQVGGYIDSLAVDTCFNVPVNASIEFISSSTTQWYSSVNTTVRLLGKTIHTNNASASVTVGAGISFIGFVGTNPSGLTVVFPAAAAANDGLHITIFSESSLVGITVTSSGATVVGNPGSLGTNGFLSFVYNHATTQWVRCG